MQLKNAQKTFSTKMAKGKMPYRDESFAFEAGEFEGFEHSWTARIAASWRTLGWRR